MNSETINTRRARQNIKIDLIRAPSFQTAVRLVTKSDWIFNNWALPPAHSLYPTEDVVFITL